MVNFDFDFFYFGEKIEQGQTLKDIGYYRGSKINITAIPRSQNTNQRVTAPVSTNFSDDGIEDYSHEEDEEEDFGADHFGYFDTDDDYSQEEEQDDDEIESLNELRNLIRFAANANLIQRNADRGAGGFFMNHARINRPIGADTTSEILKRKEKKHLYPFSVNLSEEDKSIRGEYIDCKVQLGEEFRVSRSKVEHKIASMIPEEARAVFVLNKQILDKLLHQNTRNKNVDITTDEANSVINNLVREYGMSNAKATRLYLLCFGDNAIIKSIADQLRRFNTEEINIHGDGSAGQSIFDVIRRLFNNGGESHMDEHGHYESSDSYHHYSDDGDNDSGSDFDVYHPNDDSDIDVD